MGIKRYGLSIHREALVSPGVTDTGVSRPIPLTLGPDGVPVSEQELLVLVAEEELNAVEARLNSLLARERTQSEATLELRALLVQLRGNLGNGALFDELWPIAASMRVALDRMTP